MAISQTSGPTLHQPTIGTTGPKSTGPSLGTGQWGGSGVKVVAFKPSTPPKPTTVDRSPKPLPGRNVEPRTPDYRLTRAAERAPGVETSATLKGRAGDPKADKSFGIFGVHKMSTGYKDMLAKMDDVHKFLSDDAHEMSMPPHYRSPMKSYTDSGRLHELENTLDFAMASANKYMKGRSHSHKTEIGEVREQIKAEQKLVESLLSQMKKGGTFPPDRSLSEIMDFARLGFTLDNMHDLHGLTPAQARHIVENNLLDRNLTPTQLHDYGKAGFTRGEAILLEKSGIGIEGGLLYRKMDIPIRPDTIVTSFDETTRTSGMTKLGSGAFNTVYSVDYDSGGGDYHAVYKPLSPPDLTRTTKVEKGWVAARTGIDPYNPQIALRNVATCSVAKKLGFDVVPHTEIGIRGLSSGGGELGIVMSRAPGNPAAKTDPALFERGDVRREIVKLQLLDHLVGQGDRHGNNYFIAIDKNGQAVVTGIDNDQCLGKDLHDPNGIAQGTSPLDKGFRGRKMPPIIDTDMASMIRGMTDTDLADCLKGLKPEEIRAAKDRLVGLKVHVSDLQMKNRIIKPEQWGQDWVGAEFRNENSYVGRDYERALQRTNQII
ncbi:hypothetical protein [Prosthecodimorpha staleyi]|uniref:PI3K/PI4K catalytic domain-containing protein n=1 Tax=Prosthecodimorpha staleyi TaxID=2840188 RepID=A0A947D896_9HYPH|nr:hypothetical protein [Prosthecodimorpha staleyi]MBT9292933.1 hypothetical protein [Prosthecodimorpha staleyi]